MMSTRVLEKELVCKLCKDSELFNYFSYVVDTCSREGASIKTMQGFGQNFSILGFYFNVSILSLYTL